MTSKHSVQQDDRSSRRRGRKSWKKGLVMLGLSFAVEASALKRRGYGLAGWVTVRCRRGHIFDTLWIPAASVKALRLGMWRVQRCPVGAHWALVTPVRKDQLTDDERATAAGYRGAPIP
jgi:hypothetical protein